MKKLVIDRKVWLRGEGSMLSKLFRSRDSKMCCIGIYLAQCGMNASALRDIGGAINVAEIPDECAWLNERYGRAVQPFYTANDNSQLSESVRESEIRKLFSAQGIEVEFIN